MANLTSNLQRIDAGNHFGVTTHPSTIGRLIPMDFVPTIEDGDFQLWESNVIVRYLAHKAEDARLFPTELRGRFDAERWMDWQATVFWPALRPLFIQLIRTKPQNRDAMIIARAEELSLERCADMLDARLSDRAFLAGDLVFDGRYSSRGGGSPLVRAGDCNILSFVICSAGTSE